MNTRLKSVLAMAALAVAGHAVAQVTFYENDNYQGRSFTTQQPVGDFERFGFNERASSVLVQGERWEACEDVRYSGRCVVLRPGQYANLAAMGMGDRLSSARSANRFARAEEPRYVPAPPPVPLPVAAQVIFYERENFEGRSLTADAPIDNLQRSGFNDSASSAVVLGERWEVCSDAGYRGNCVVLRPGRYPSLAAMGLNNSVSSLRTVQRDARVDDNRYAPPPAPVYDNRPRRDERLYEVNITSVRAVVAQSGQRCWVEREPVAQVRSGPNVGGALVGAVIGGILGHQVGGGIGKDIATAGGAIAGGVIGSNIGRDGSAQTGQTQEVQRCENTGAQATPAYWEVVYSFQGQEHRAQMAKQPGPTIIVNERGEPRA